MLIDGLSAEFGTSFEKGASVVFVLSEYDCEICIRSISNWLDNIEAYEKQTNSAIGIRALVYTPHDKIENQAIEKIFFENPAMPVKITQEAMIFALLAKEYSMSKLPAGILIREGKIVYIRSVNAEFFSFD